MTLSKMELGELKSLVDSDAWEIYLGWLDSQIEETFKELFNLENPDLETFVKLQSRLRTLKDVSFFFELELFTEMDGRKTTPQSKEKLAAVVNRYSERFFGIFKKMRKPVHG